MIIKTVSQLLKSDYSIDSILDLVMKTESLSFIKELQETRQTYENRLKISPDYIYLFFDNDKNYIGYLTAEFLQKIPECKEDISFNHSPKDYKQNGILYISSFAINPDARKNHTGTNAFNNVLANFKKDQNILTIVLLVNQEWGNAIHIYQKAGFEIINSFDNTFPPENSESWTSGILMKLSLK